MEAPTEETVLAIYLQQKLILNFMFNLFYIALISFFFMILDKF